MVTIEIDEEVYSYLEKKAISFVDKSPNDVLRRLFKLDRIEKLSNKKFNVAPTRKKPKTNLADLINAGLLVNGQKLYIKDYQKNIIPGYDVKVSNGFLVYDGTTYSMSDLARYILQDNGYKSDSVRGPMFWFTKEGKSIKELWDLYLSKNYKY